MNKIFMCAQSDALIPPTRLHEQVKQFSEHTDQILNHPTGASLDTVDSDLKLINLLYLGA